MKTVNNSKATTSRSKTSRKKVQPAVVQVEENRLLMYLLLPFKLIAILFVLFYRLTMKAPEYSPNYVGGFFRLIFWGYYLSLQLDAPFGFGSEFESWFSNVFGSVLGGFLFWMNGALSFFMVFYSFLIMCGFQTRYTYTAYQTRIMDEEERRNPYPNISNVMKTLEGDLSQMSRRQGANHLSKFMGGGGTSV